MNVSCVDLFCGAGGLSHGLIRGGVKVNAGVDIDPHCRYPYEANNGAQFIDESVESLRAEDIEKLFDNGSVKLLAGCAPCQPFSSYSRGKGDKNHERWDLLKSFGRLVSAVQPDLVTMENVPELPKHDVFEDFLRCLDGYHVSTQVVNCNNYGLPQHRRRLVLIASRLGPIKLIPPTHTEGREITVRQAIGHLPAIRAGQKCESDPLHASSGLTEINLKRIRQSKPGGTWRDWDEELVASCHRKSSGRTYPSVYGRMEWDKPSPTMTTLCYGYGNGRFGHPEQDRAISLREAAIFQSFPPDYKFVPAGQPVHFKIVGRLIGNAVPVRLGEVIAESVRQHLKGQG